MYKYLYTMLMGMLCLACTASAATLYSRANGAWSTIGTWSYTPGGPSCGCTPIASDNVTINHTVTMDKNLTNQGSSLNGITGILTINAGGSLLGGNTYDIDIRSSGQLNLCGTLTAHDVTFSNGSVVNVCSTGNLTVNHDFFNKNSSNDVTINGTMTVGGAYQNGNGGVISGNGTINITNGPVTNTGTTFGCTGNDPCNNTYPCSVSGLTGPCASPLPVTFLDLKAEWLGADVDVKWVTASEVNNARFDVMRSTDGVFFSDVASVPGQGTTSQTHTYSLEDKDVPPAHILYYRVRQTDFDGHSSTSQTVALSRKSGHFEVRLYPNPFQVSSGAGVDVLVEGSLENIKMELTDATGRLVLSRQETGGDYMLFHLPTEGLSAGMYLFKLTDGVNTYSCKLVSFK